MIHTSISAAQQWVFVSNHPQIVEKVAENKGLYDESPLRKTPALHAQFGSRGPIIALRSRMLMPPRLVA